MARDSTVAFTDKNFTRLMESYPGFARTSIIHLFDGYCAAGDRARLDTIIRPKLKTIGGGDLELAQVGQGIARCAALKAAKGAEVRAVLATF